MSLHSNDTTLKHCILGSLICNTTFDIYADYFNRTLPVSILLKISISQRHLYTCFLFRCEVNQNVLHLIDDDNTIFMVVLSYPVYRLYPDMLLYSSE